MAAPHALFRVPEFLVAARAQAAVEQATFLSAGGDHLPATVWSSGPARNLPSEPTSAPVVVFPQADAAGSIAALERKLGETASRVDLAVERLRAVGERLAAEARADAFEIGLAAARRLVEAELTVNPEAQLAFIRAALRRLGEARAVTVRLAPKHAAALEASGAGAKLGTPSSAHLEILADPSLEPGDCVVDGDLASVDGRLSTRFEELRRSLLEEIGEDVK